MRDFTKGALFMFGVILFGKSVYEIGRRDERQKNENSNSKSSDKEKS